MVSEYNKFVSQHIRSAKGATQKDKMRAVAAMWRARKGKGKGLMAPSGRGLRLPGGKGVKGKGWDWKNYTHPFGIGRGVRKGKGAMPLFPGREGASGGRVSSQTKLAKMIHGLGTGKKRGGAASQGALAALLHGLNIKVQ
jgi:hypothetical protein